MDNLLLFFIALIPVVWLIVSLGVLKIPGYKACAIALAITSLLPPAEKGTTILIVFGTATCAAAAPARWCSMRWPMGWRSMPRRSVPLEPAAVTHWTQAAGRPGYSGQP